MAAAVAATATPVGADDDEDWVHVASTDDPAPSTAPAAAAAATAAATPATPPVASPCTALIPISGVRDVKVEPEPELMFTFRQTKAGQAMEAARVRARLEAAAPTDAAELARFWLQVKDLPLPTFYDNILRLNEVRGLLRDVAGKRLNFSLPSRADPSVGVAATTATTTAAAAAGAGCANVTAA